MIKSYTKHCIEAAIGKSRPKALMKAIASLHGHYTPVLRSVLSALPGGEDIISKQERNLAAWVNAEEKLDHVIEIFEPRNDRDTLIVLQIPNITSLKTDFGKRFHTKTAGYLIVYGFAKTDSGRTRVESFRKSLAKAVAKAFPLKKEPQIASIGIINEKFEKLGKKKNTTPPIYSELVPAIELLTDVQFRNVIIRTRQAKDPTLENIAKSTGLDASVVEPLLSRAVDSKILTKQYNLVCVKCSNVLARVQSTGALAQMQRDGVSCPMCRTKVDQDSHVNCYVVSDHIDPILTGSEWMHMYLRRQIDPFLPGPSSITSVVDGPNELDLVANVDGDLLLAEFKDNRFSIGHAYSFVGKCSQYQPDLSLIVATQGIDDDVKEYIKNTGILPYYIERIGDVQQVLEGMFSQRNAQRLAQLLGVISWNSLVAEAVLSHFDASLPIPRDPYRLSYSLGRVARWKTE